jgi:hypothetical protein
VTDSVVVVADVSAGTVVVSDPATGSPVVIVADPSGGNSVVLVEQIQGAPGSTLGVITLTGDTTGSGAGGTVPNENIGLLNHLLPILAPGYLNWNGSGWALTAVSVPNPTGTGFWFESAGVLNAAAITIDGDVAQGALTANTIPLEVTGLLNHVLPALTTGFLEWSGSAWTLSAITSAQLPTITLTGDVTGSGSGGSIATTLSAIDGHTLPAPSGTGTVLQWSGSALSWATSASTSVTGTGLWYSVGGTLQSAAVTLSGDVSQGALASPNVPLTVTGLQSKALPSLAAGFLQYTGSAWSLAAITSAQLPTITLTGQVTGAGSGGSIATTITSANLPAITLTSDTTGGPTAGGSIATTTVSARSGGYLFGSSGSITWLNSYAANLIQTSVATTPAANFTITPQQSSNANATQGSMVIALAAFAGSGTEANFTVTRAGTNVFATGAQPTSSTIGCIWLMTPTPSSTNYALRNDGTSTHLNCNSGAGNLYFLIGGATFAATATASGVQLGASATSFGGGAGSMLGLTAATTQPTSNPAGGGAIIYSTANNFSAGQGGVLVRGSNGGVVNVAAAGSTTTVNSQTQGYDQVFGTCETTTNAATTIQTYGTTTGKGGMINVYVVGRSITSGTSVTVGATTCNAGTFAWKNVGGTVSVAGPSALGLTTSTDIGLGGATLSATVSGNVITLKVANAGTTSTTTMDWLAWIQVIID